MKKKLARMFAMPFIDELEKEYRAEAKKYENQGDSFLARKILGKIDVLNDIRAKLKK